MKRIQQVDLSAGRRELGSLRSFRVQALSGTVKATFDGEEILLSSGDVFELPAGMFFRNVSVFLASGASATIIFGMVSFGGGGGSGSGTGGLYGTSDPEGVTTASPGATYINTTDGSFWVKQSGTGNTGWLELIA